MMVNDPGAEEWKTGSVAIEHLGEWSGVGIRFKGFFGSLRICIQKFFVIFGMELMHLFNVFPQCNKLSYKLKFNHVDKKQRFFGLKRLQLHASILGSISDEGKIVLQSLP